MISAAFEKIGALLADLRSAGCSDVTFAGAMVRPTLDLVRLDAKAMEMAASLTLGDAATLRSVSAFFEREGFRVVGAHEALAGLLMPLGVLGKVSPAAVDQDDAARGMAIVAAIGAIDVGQSAVVAQGICLGVESVQGSDALLDFVALNGRRFLPDPNGSKGVLCKAPKPGQDWRMDLPAIGPQTVAKAATAGLAGVVVQAGGVLVLGLAETIAEADRLGLFLWGRKGG